VNIASSVKTLHMLLKMKLSLQAFIPPLLSSAKNCVLWVRKFKIKVISQYKSIWLRSNLEFN
ncbi:hypothetical protein L9F63_006784, partial [Diploptera punctata]